MSSQDTAGEILAQIKQHAIKFVDLQFTDLGGMVKNLTIPASRLDDVLAGGIWFDGSAIEGYARVAESDMHLRPDPGSFAILPWSTGDDVTARLICNVYTPDGQPFAGDPRSVLARALAEARQMGFGYYTGPEIEFFLLKPYPDGSLLPVVPCDASGYFDAPSDLAAGLRRQMTATLASFGIEVEALHHEIASGQQEIDFHYADALTSADNTVTFRVALKVVAQMHGLYGTFMPKPMREAAGSGLHVHQSLTYIATGQNAFHDPGDPYGLSAIARQFVAGQLAHARGMCAVLAPLVNSYKRLAAGYEAPVHISWARVNRAALIRVPRASGPESTRLELRCPDPSCNPYLAFAVMLAAGLDGIRRGLSAPDANEENLYLPDVPRKSLQVLPGSLSQALDALEEDDVIKNALGPHITTRFLEAKRLEWGEYRLEVSPWELAKYLARY